MKLGIIFGVLERYHIYKKTSVREGIEREEDASVLGGQKQHKWTVFSEHAKRPVLTALE